MYTIGQIFEGVYPPEAAVWCNKNNAVMVDLGNGTYQIQAVPELTLAEVKAQKMDAIDATTQQKIIAGFWYQDPILMETQLHFSFDTIDQSNFNSAMNGANLYLISQASGASVMTPSTISWNGYTDIEHQNLVKIIFNAEQFINFWGYAETIHKNGILEEARIFKAEVTACTSVECVNNVVW